MLRLREPEIMDNPGLAPDRHRLALDGLARLNLLSGNARILWSQIEPLARRLQSRSLTLLDIASGSGDVPISLWRLAQRANIRLEIHGCDISGTAVEYAKKMAHKACADVDFFVQDAFEPSILNDYDIITNSLFIHHLDEENVVKFFRLASQRARHLMLISDLVRGSINLAMVSLASRLVSRSDVVHFDGPASVRAAFTPAEFRNFAERAGLHGAQVQNYFPCRMLFTWVRPHG